MLVVYSLLTCVSTLNPNVKQPSRARPVQPADVCCMAGPTASMETGFTKGATKGTKLGPAPSEAGTLRKAPRKLSLSFRNAPPLGEAPPELHAIWRLPGAHMVHFRRFRMLHRLQLVMGPAVQMRSD